MEVIVERSKMEVPTHTRNERRGATLLGRHHSELRRRYEVGWPVPSIAEPGP